MGNDEPKGVLYSPDACESEPQGAASATIAEEPSKVDAIPISPPFPCPLDIIIVGAGIGGLATAYLLGKAGHKVTVLEGSSNLSEVGADIDPSTPSVTLSSGEVFKGDLLVGADGLHSRVRDTVVGHKDDPIPTGDAAYRAIIPTDLILADPELKFLVEEQSTNVWFGPGRCLVGYCLRQNKMYNLVMPHPAKDMNEKVRDASVEDMRAEYAAFELRVRKLLDLVPSTMLWSLMDRLPLETWVHSEGKVCLLGDACHPMLPFRAQGAAIALEDAAVLGNLLARITSHSELPALLKAYQSLRHPRASAAQAASRQNHHIFHLPDGPAQKVRDAALRLAMEAALKEARGESFEDCEGSPSLWADRKANMVAFGYDADAEVEKWWKENWGKESDKGEALAAKEE
ncbi:hypothetical protein BKA70DRAFT_1437890 [Coprinopsis sp. MPI-PUGE-AT-0042]|nr:hypothetical protein BKA70DRAFT_1437890 [Coprinopsis sp. MPI-PUGE-AT-0042]